ncbi:MAG: fumarylacetoacetate hydrolase family protein, partial [Desulfobacterales bacterium]
MDQISKAAEFIAGLRFALRQESQIPEAFRPDNPASGYAVQEGVVDRLLKKYGGHAVGYKVACTNKLAQDLLGTDTPFYGRLLSPFVYQSPASVNAQAFSMRLIEAEFSFQLARDMPREDSPYDRELVADAVAAVLPSIELVDTRYTSWTEVALPSLISDNGCNGGWVQGGAIEAWRHIDLASHEVRVSVNGAEKLSGSGAAVLGHPLNSLAWLANALCEQGKQLKAGDLVSTGVCTDIYLAEPGDHIVADFGTLGIA